MKKTIFLILAVFLMKIENDLSAQALVISEKIMNNSSGSFPIAVKTSYYSRERTYIDDSSQPFKVLFDYRKGKVYLIDHSARKNSEMSAEHFIKIANASMSGLAVLTEKDVAIKKTNENKKLEGHVCYKTEIVISKMGMRMEYWTSRVAGVSLDEYYRFAQRFASSKALRPVNEMMKKDNVYPIVSVVMLPTATINTVCTSIRMLGANESIPALPANYQMIVLPEK